MVSCIDYNSLNHFTGHINMMHVLVFLVLIYHTHIWPARYFLIDALHRTPDVAGHFEILH